MWRIQMFYKIISAEENILSSFHISSMDVHDQNTLLRSLLSFFFTATIHCHDFCCVNEMHEYFFELVCRNYRSWSKFFLGVHRLKQLIGYALFDLTYVMFNLFLIPLVFFIYCGCACTNSDASCRKWSFEVHLQTTPTCSYSSHEK